MKLLVAVDVTFYNIGNGYNLSKELMLERNKDGKV